MLWLEEVSSLFLVLFSLLILQRIVELFLAKRNEAYARKEGAIEYGKSHYPWMVALHTAWLVSMLVEESLFPESSYEVFVSWLVGLWVSVQIFRYWIVVSLGRYWNTRVLIIPGGPLVKKGLYRWFKHPNYIIVIIEIALFPLIFSLFITAVIFSILNIILLISRVKVENEALKHLIPQQDQNTKSTN